MIARGPHAFAGHRPVGQVEVFVFTKGQFHQRAEGLDEYMGRLQQGTETRPCIKLRKVGNHRQGEEGGEPGDAHQRLTLCSPCSGVKAAWWWVSGKVSSMQILPLFSCQDLWGKKCLRTLNKTNFWIGTFQGRRARRHNDRK